MSHTSRIEPTRHEDGRPMLLGGLRRHHAMADPAHGPARWEHGAPRTQPGSTEP